MKNKLFALAVALVMITFAVNTTVMAQSKDSKYPESKGKTTVQKTINKSGDLKQTAKTVVNENKTKTKENGTMVKNDMKKSTGKDMKKMESEVKHHKMITNKSEKKPNDKTKK
ncbi:MAG: hypothetical protein IH620_04955 [Ignavibacterium sp.]|nr:hypothetical protein [Ignavibacterium sp.]